MWALIPRLDVDIDVDIDMDVDAFKIVGYELQVNSVGLGKGLAVYYDKEIFQHSADIKKPLFQITKMSSTELDVIAV